MRTPALSSAFLLAAVLAPATAVAQSKPKPITKSVLDEYVNRKHVFNWKVNKTEQLADGVKVVRIEMTSQVWQGLTWKHRLNLIVPPAATGKRARPGHCLLAITGSGGGRQFLTILTTAALRMGVPIAVLHDVPNQPLYRKLTKNNRGLREDALIAYTFKKYYETGDTDWPLLLPMTRSAMAAMDALEAYSTQQAQVKGGTPWSFGTLKKFVTTGGSKRGWTTWLTGVVEPRVIGIAPIVFDNLNFAAQIDLHMKTWGKPSPSIHDYTDIGLLKMMGTKRGKRLLSIVDPFSYRKRLGVPKLVLIGTNDTYWPLDSINIYRGQLPGQMHFHYVPNGGHGAGLSVLQALSGFFDHVTHRTPSLPGVDLLIRPRKGAQLSAKRLNDHDRVGKVHLWAAHVDGKDFTKARWTKVRAETLGRASWKAMLPEATLAKAGSAAFIGEVQLKDSSGHPFTVHSPVQVWELGPRQ